MSGPFGAALDHGGAGADDGETVGAAGERAVLAALTGLARERARRGGNSAGSLIATGDDAAVVSVTSPLVVSVDTAVEGRHFRFDWSTPEQIGARAVVAAVSDITAMGARPTGVLVSLGCPAATPVARIAGIQRGIVGQADRWGARVLGGDLVATAEVVVSVTALGAVDAGIVDAGAGDTGVVGAGVVPLSGARAGDVLAVSGPLGAAAGGLAVLLTGDDALARRYDDLVGRFRLPQPDPAQGPAAARAGAHALTDISDGLVEELRTVAAASGAGLHVDSRRVPRAPALDDLAAELAVDPRDWALAGGEDHELLGAFAPGDVPPGWTVIGHVTAADPGAALVDGTAVGALRGWQSFDD